MTAKDTDNVGGLPPLSAFQLAVWRDWMTSEQADRLGADLRRWLIAHAELCRAAPAGGDPTPLEKMAENARDLGLDYGPRSCPFCGYSMTEFPGLDSEHIGQWIFQNEREEFGLICGACEAEGPAASTKAGAIQTWNERHDATVFGHSAPAGSGEVGELIDRLETEARLLVGCIGRSDQSSDVRALRDAAALLRKLQQGADYVMVPREPDPCVIRAMRDAFRSVRRGGIGGQTLEACYQREYAPELAAYHTMIAASQDQDGGNGNARD